MKRKLLMCLMMTMAVLTGCSGSQTQTPKYYTTEQMQKFQEENFMTAYPGGDSHCLFVRITGDEGKTIHLKGVIIYDDQSEQEFEVKELSHKEVALLKIDDPSGKTPAGYNVTCIEELDVPNPMDSLTLETLPYSNGLEYTVTNSNDRAVIVSGMVNNIPLDGTTDDLYFVQTDPIRVEAGETKVFPVTPSDTTKKAQGLYYGILVDFAE